MSARGSRRWLIFTGAFCVACNPALDDKISALGPEQPGVPRGPDHRPGQPCTLCHDGSLGDPPGFSVAGTVYRNANDTSPLSAATVTLTDVFGNTQTATANDVGSFYLTPSDFQPIYPMRVTVTSGSTTVTMQSHVGWNGSCAGCHVDPAGPDSPGHVYFNVPSGGTP